MPFLVVDNNVNYIEDGNNINLLDNLPLGFYTLYCGKTGPFLSKTPFKLEHGKIYGDAEKIANHVVEAYNKSADSGKNLGVLFSGGKGLGKTLTSRLVVEKLYQKHPVISVNSFNPFISDFLSHIDNAIIIMDEFEKFMGGNASGSDNSDDMTKQESILSTLDGNTGCKNNLFILTVNETRKLDDNLLSRPGRIRYHFKFNSEKAAIVRGYCEENLNNKSMIEEVVDVLGASKYVSLDIISSFVDEMNMFPDRKPNDIIKYFNIECNNTFYKFSVKLSVRGHEQVFSCTNRSKAVDSDWFQPKGASNLKVGDNAFVSHVRITIPEEIIPDYIYLKHSFDPERINLESFLVRDLDEDDVESDVKLEEIKILEAWCEDADAEKFDRTYRMAY